MMERIPFKKMLDLVEKETGLDNKESDRLVRHWFGIINEGLEKDGRVRISKFGTFKLQSVAERNGINPITREAMLIPAHTKVGFKSAKYLRETVNKKYNLLEAKPIKMEEKKTNKKETINTNGQNEDINNESTKKNSENEIDELVSQITETTSTENMELKNENKSKPDTEKTKIEQLKRKQSEEVRAKIEEKFSQKENDFTPNGVMSVKEEDTKSEEKDEKEIIDQDSEVEEKKTVEKTELQKTEPEKVEVIIEKETKVEEPKQPISEPEKKEKKSKTGLWISIAAIFILLIIILLFWKPWRTVEEVVAEKPMVQEEVKPEPPPKPKVPKIVYKTAGGEHAVNRGDKLWDLSDEFYRDAYLWPNIYRVNDKNIPNPDILVIGNVVTIPPLEGTYQNLTANDSVNISVGFYKAYKAYQKNGNQWAKYYLWVCKKYDRKTFNGYEKNVEQEDFLFALSMK